MNQPNDGTLSVEEALGDINAEHEWRSADGKVWCTYGRPKGVVSATISRALGPENAGNLYLQAQFRALLSIRTWCDKRAVRPADAAMFQTAIDRFGDDGGADERFNDFVATVIATLYPADDSELDTAKK